MLPFFANSPVVEVAVAVAFQPVAKLRTIELVRLWDELFSEQFPRAEELPPYQMPVERFEDRPIAPTFSVQFGQGIPAPRLLFRTVEDDQVIQLQNNYFARNWRKAGPEAEYPRYPNLYEPFNQDLSRLGGYLQEHELGGVQPVQCELTYINHIVAPTPGSDLGDVLSIVARSPRLPEGLQEPDDIRVSAQFLIRHNEDYVGRVYVTAEPAVRRTDNARITVLNVTARGRPLGDGIGGVLGFLTLAHSRAVETFDGVTRPEMHGLWGKSYDG